MLNNKLFTNAIFNHNYFYPTPINLNYTWSFGSPSGLFSALQLITGIFLAMHYVPNEILAFPSVEHILRDVNFGFILKNLHANGASSIFLFLFLHIARGLIIRSYPNTRLSLWKTGILLFLLMVITAFIGYVLPWGQMSYWGATVITNLITAIPYIGNSLAIWIWGNYTVSNATLNRFFSLHYVLPFIILGLISCHLSILHQIGSSSPILIKTTRDKITFSTYHGNKDLFPFTAATVIFSFPVFFEPNYLGHSDNFIPANALLTPAHIVPEWYLLPFYAILRPIPNKLFGVIAMIGAIPFLSLISWITLYNTYFFKTLKFVPGKKFLIFLSYANFTLSGFIGGNPAEKPYTDFGKFASVNYFIILILLELNISKFVLE